MNWLLILPVLIPLLTAVSAFLSRRSIRAQHWLNVLGALGVLITAALLLFDVSGGDIRVMHLGGWKAPFGIVLVADVLSALMLLLSSLLGLAVALYSIASVDASHKRYGYVPLFQVLLMGVNGAFLTGDMFNLYVWFEVMLIASFVLMVLGGKKAQLVGAVKYVTINLLASMLFLIGAGVLYGKTGTLNFADLAVILMQNPEPELANTTAILFLVAFGIKAAVFPFFFWLPDSYHVPSAAVTAIFSGLLTKVGVYAMMRTFTLIFVYDASFTQPLFLVLASLTMITGVIGAVAQGEMKRLLSFHIVSQIGYALMGLGIFTQLAFSGAIYFTIHVAIAKAALFLVAGYVAATQGTTELKRLGGMLRQSPLLAVLFLIAALSLAGLPPFSGFFAKFALVKAGLEASRYAIVAVALTVGVLTLFSMTKMWNEIFWKDAPQSGAARRIPQLSRGSMMSYVLPMLLLVGITVVMGLAAEPVLQLTGRAAEQLLQPSQYINAVLGGLP
ncbi:MAG: Na+/H+ antiporter subunit D [Ignavibacteria bacterium]|nr:MAG: Na+/H+ antiporter subunit D [Ignavibacteria bacterium]